jgi:hypothetical protein
MEGGEKIRRWLGYCAYFSFCIFIYSIMVDTTFVAQRYAALARAALWLSYQKATIDARAE